MRLPLRSRGVSGNRHVLPATTYEDGKLGKRQLMGASTNVIISQIAEKAMKT